MKRSIRKSVKFSESEWEKVLENSEKCSMKPATFMRHSAVNREIKVFDLTEFDIAFNHLSSISNNINQIAKVANSTKSVYENDIINIKSQMEYLKIVIDNLEEAVFGEGG